MRHLIPTITILFFIAVGFQNCAKVDNSAESSDFPPKTELTITSLGFLDSPIEISFEVTPQSNGSLTYTFFTLNLETGAGSASTNTNSEKLIADYCIEKNTLSLISSAITSLKICRFEYQQTAPFVCALVYTPAILTLQYENQDNIILGGSYCYETHTDVCKEFQDDLLVLKEDLEKVFVDENKYSCN